MISGNSICYLLQEYRFTGFWLGNYKTTLTFTYRGKQVHDPGAITIRSCKKVQLFVRKKWCEIVERYTVAYIFRTFTIYCFNFEKSKIFFTFFWRSYGTVNGITCF